MALWLLFCLHNLQKIIKNHQKSSKLQAFCEYFKFLGGLIFGLKMHFPSISSSKLAHFRILGCILPLETTPCTLGGLVRLIIFKNYQFSENRQDLCIFQVSRRPHFLPENAFPQHFFVKSRSFSNCRLYFTLRNHLIHFGGSCATHNLQKSSIFRKSLDQSPYNAI